MNNHHFDRRLQLAIAITESAGQAILKLRETGVLPKAKIHPDGQLKSSVDVAVEHWILFLLKTYYPNEEVLSEERHGLAKGFTHQGSGYWVVDPIDGTRSYCEGYEGFCVQVAYIKNGKPLVAVVHAPALGLTYWAVINGGAYMKRGNATSKLVLKKRTPFNATYIDSRPATDGTARILKQAGANKFLEMGSYGIKICKVAEGKAGVFLKPGEFKIWDTAPGSLILSEAGGKLSLWDGSEIDYSGKKIYFKDLVAASGLYHKKMLRYL